MIAIDKHVAVRLDFDAHAPAFSKAMVALVCLIVTINAWNAIGVSTRVWMPGSYQP